ncbi:P-loop containing nucleoside triphosphate hydrolase protein [Russula aff. rugulosa BPL654]|nr:P-loop containing nucleoside triphosphate hydrolase protein [Russula aff. rugulosa BPL654]
MNMQSVKGFLAPLGVNTNSIQDTLKLVVIGGTVETARRASMSAWNGFVDSFYLTAHFSQEDYPYDWQAVYRLLLMHWLSKQPAWGRSREFEITTRSVGRNQMNQTMAGDLDEEEMEEENEDELEHGRRKRKRSDVQIGTEFFPHTRHHSYDILPRHWLKITRTRRYQDYGYSGLKISVVARNNDILKKLVLDARREYEKDAEHRVQIFKADTTYACWKWNGARQKRPMSSIVLEPAVKEMLLADCRDFLRSEDWYAERGELLLCIKMQVFMILYWKGIPFRRGFLLHGVPGSGKTSLIHSLAGELGLDIYVVSLSSKGMSDNTLSTLMGSVPPRCILLLEDLDATFTRGISRDSTSTGAPTTPTKVAAEVNDGSTLSLSGLLNSLDGITAEEGRPGRMDVWVNFTNATKWQAEGIFKCFFPSRPSAHFITPSSDEASHLRTLQRRTLPTLGLAKRFADAIPEGEMSPTRVLAQEQDPTTECVEEVPNGARQYLLVWLFRRELMFLQLHRVLQEREARGKMKREREKEEREAKERKEAEELAQKRGKNGEREKSLHIREQESEHSSLSVPSTLAQSGYVRLTTTVYTVASPINAAATSDVSDDVSDAFEDGRSRRGPCGSERRG